MIKEDYVSFEVAKLLKKKGFDEPCHKCYYIPTKELDDVYYGVNSGLDRDFISCPTHQLAMAWLREKGIYIDISIIITTDDKVYYHASCGTIANAWKLVDEWNDGYEGCVEAAIKYTLENLI